MFRSRTLQLLAQRLPHDPAPRAFVGLDGFVDTIVAAVDQRRGQGEDFTPIPTLAALGRRISAAAGQSTNIELYPRLDKLGGNGPIMANALLAAGVAVTYAGALGTPEVHPVFAELARRGRVHSLCAPAHTTALEFSDGKLMLGVMRSLDEVTFDRLKKKIGPDRLRSELADAALVALVNWTMVPNMSAILAGLADEFLPLLPANPKRVFFFDLADPEKRTREDLAAVLKIMARWQRFGRVVLGLNFKEAVQVAQVFQIALASEAEADLRRAAEALRAQLEVECVVIHPRHSAACATPDGTSWVPGPYTESPLITTGAGDHFNAGFARGLLLGLPPEACLTLGVCTSGHYVRTAQSPSLQDLETFLAKWCD
jgi:sugar/nucleoside kinase (ribokinase family)